MFFVVETTILEMEMEIDSSECLRSRPFYLQVKILCRLILQVKKVWRCSSFSSVSSLAWSVVVECRKKMFVLIDVLKRFFLSSCLLDSYTSISSIWQLSLWTSNIDTFLFPCPRRKSVILSSLKSCRCLQAQWWKAKSLLDRWNLPSGYVSSMESNCWASKNFLSVDPLEILLSVRREKNDENV